MDLAVFLSFLARRAWIVALLAILGAGLGLAWAAAQTEVYEGLTRVKVFPMRVADLGQTQALQSMIRSYALDVPTVDMSRRVAAQLGVGEAETARWRLEHHIAADVDPNLYEIQVKARSADAAEAERLSLQWATAFIAQRTAASRQLDPMDRVVATLRDNATHTVYAPRRKLLVAGGAVLGALAGVLLALLLEYLSQAVVRDAAVAGRLTGAPVLASLPGPRGGFGLRGRSSWREARRLAGSGARLGWPVLALAVLGAVAALAFSAVQPAEVRARTRIAVEPGRASDWGQTQSIQETLRGYAADIATRRMAEVVGEAEQLDLPADELLDWVTVAPEPGAFEIYLDVRHPDPDTARRVSLRWAETFIAERQMANLNLDQPDRTLLRVRDETAVELWAPKVGVNLLAGLVMGALVGLVLAYVLWWWERRRVRSEEDARRASGLPALAGIPQRSRP